MSKQPGLDPAAVYRSLTAFASDKPQKDTFVGVGIRLRGDHPIVVAHPTMFALDSLSDPEIEAIMRERRLRNF